MSFFLLYLLKMSLCSGVLYGYYHIALRNRVFHQYNRFYLLAAVLFSLLFPLVPLPNFYNVASPADPAQLYRLLYLSSSESVVTAQSAKSWDWQPVLTGIYAAVCLVLAVRLVAGLMHLYKLIRLSDVKKMGSVLFVLTQHRAAPFSFFNWLFWKNSIDIETESGQSVFRHELVHIQEKHTLDKLAMQVVLLFFWINPFFWIIRRELQLIHEFIADRQAAASAGTASFAAMILQAAYSNNYSALINPFFQQSIKRRLAMLQKTLKQPQNAYLGRILALPLCALLLFAFARRDAAKSTVTKPAAPEVVITTALKDTIPADKIKEVRVNKKDSVKSITILYTDGTQETLTEKQAMEKGLINPPPPPPPPPPAPMPNLALLVIDGKEQGPIGDSKKMDAINPDDIESMNVLKGENATKKYGKKGTHGVIEIITKKEKQRQSTSSGTSTMVPPQDANIVFIEVEQPPHFPGGKDAWQAFLQKNLNAGAPVEKGAPPGTYNVQVQFKVANDGTISEIQPQSALGYGMEGEVVALMHKSPKWVPAEQNGHKVTTLHKQTVTFVIAEAEKEK